MADRNEFEAALEALRADVESSLESLRVELADERQRNVQLRAQVLTLRALISTLLAADNWYSESVIKRLDRVTSASPFRDDEEIPDHACDWKELRDLMHEITDSQTTRASDARDAIARYAERVTRLEGRSDRHAEALETLTQRQEDALGLAFSEVLTSHLGFTQQDVPLFRAVPVRIYLHERLNHEHIENTESAVLGFVQELGLVIGFAFREVKGPWYKRFFAWTATPETQQQVQAKLEGFQQTADQQGRYKPASEVDANQAYAFSVLMKAIEHQPNAVLQIGSLSIVKTSRGVVTRTLTPQEMMRAENFDNAGQLNEALAILRGSMAGP